MSFITSSSTWTNRLSGATRLISSTAISGLCAGTTMEARNLGSLSSHSAAIQSFTARANPAPMSSLNRSCTPYRQLAMAMLVWNGFSACWRNNSRSEPGRMPSTRQSGRAVSGLLAG